MTLYKREGLGDQVSTSWPSRSSGTTSKVEANALEQKWKRGIYERVQLGKSPTINQAAGDDPRCARQLDQVLGIGQSADECQASGGIAFRLRGNPK